MKKKLVIIGASEIAKLAYEYFLHDSEYEIEAFSVDRLYLNGDSLYAKPLVAYEDLVKLFPPQKYHVFVAINSMQLNRVRTKKYLDLKRKGYKFASYISSRAFVWRDAKIGENCFILEDNTIQPFVKIGNNVILWSGNHIGHSSLIEDNVFISSHVVVSGFCRIGKASFMGVNSCVADTINIGEDNFIGMGTVINKSTPNNSVITGNPFSIHRLPAKKFCKVND